jgi:hypothetical protein
MTTRNKFAETDAQIESLRRHICEECVSIASSIDTISAPMIPREIRERWLRELGLAASAVALVEERLADVPKAEA